MPWYFTSSSRAVLSARSRNVPIRAKWNASSFSIVPIITPRDRCERNLTHSKNSRGSRSSRLPSSRLLSSSQVPFDVSQNSVVNEPRTARAFSRAARMHE